MIYLCVSMTIKEGKMDEFLDECRKVRPLVLAEEGCLMYDHTREINTGSDRQDTYKESRVTLYEKWASQEALDAHLKTAHMADFSSRVADMRDEVTIRFGTEAY